ncbi:MAG: hypothetical protein ACM3ZC_13590 [Bacteroidota bacterium]
MATIMTVILFVFLILCAGACLLTKEPAPNARILAVCPEHYWKIEVICRYCGSRRLVTHPWPDAPPVVLCTECGCNILPDFMPKDKTKFLAARKEMLSREAAAARAAR